MQGRIFLGLISIVLMRFALLDAAGGGGWQWVAIGLAVMVGATAGWALR